MTTTAQNTEPATCASCRQDLEPGDGFRCKVHGEWITLCADRRACRARLRRRHRRPTRAEVAHDLIALRRRVERRERRHHRGDA